MAATARLEPAEADGGWPLDTDRFSPINRRRLSAPGLRTFLAIADLWSLREAPRLLMLGSPPRSTYHHWCSKARAYDNLVLDVDTLTRISAVLGIHKALGILFNDREGAIDWLTMPHAALPFGGQPPIDLLACGTMDAMLQVRRFLDAARGGLYMAPGAIDQDFTPYTDDDIMFAR